MGYCALVVFQQFILPVSPMVIATSFTIFATYTRRMFPCLMTGALMLTCTPLRYLIVGLRQLHIPQKLIVAISVTLRYFPAIREEVGYIRDAMKLRDIRGLARLECTVMPLMVSATETAEELSRQRDPGIEKPGPQNQRRIPEAFPSGLFGDAGRSGLAGALICGTIREAMTMISIDNVSFGYGEARRPSPGSAPPSHRGSVSCCAGPPAAARPR